MSEHEPPLLLPPNHDPYSPVAVLARIEKAIDQVRTEVAEQSRSTDRNAAKMEHIDSVLAETKGDVRDLKISLHGDADTEGLASKVRKNTESREEIAVNRRWAVGIAITITAAVVATLAAVIMPLVT